MSALPLKVILGMSLILASLVSPAYAQDCTGMVILDSQAEVDAFDCTHVSGALIIEGDDISDLSPLSVLVSVEDNLFISSGALTSLSGLEALTSVGGGLSINSSDMLPSLAGLESLVSVGGTLRIYSNFSLTSLSGLDALSSVGLDLEVRSNGFLPSLSGLDALASVGRRLYISGNESLSSLSGLENLGFIGGGVFITLNDELPSFSGLEGLVSIEGDVIISFNHALTSFAGLEALTSLDGSLDVRSNNALTSLSGLDNLSSIAGDLEVDGNLSLSECACGLAGLISGDPPAFTGVDGTVAIAHNAPPPNGRCTSPNVVLATGCALVADEPVPGSPGRFVLDPLYPNPLGIQASMGYDLPEAADVRVVVYDVLGREVAVVADEAQEAGRHEVAFDASGLAAGTYVVRVTTGGGFAATQRITVVR